MTTGRINQVAIVWHPDTNGGDSKLRAEAHRRRQTQHPWHRVTTRPPRRDWSALLNRTQLDRHRVNDTDNVFTGVTDTKGLAQQSAGSRKPTWNLFLSRRHRTKQALTISGKGFAKGYFQRRPFTRLSATSINPQTQK